MFPCVRINDDDDADEWGDGSRTLYLTFDGENWVKYDLSLLPSTYHHRNTRERVDITFQTNAPDGLIWFSGNERNNIQLSLRVRSDGTECSSVLKLAVRY